MQNIKFLSTATLIATMGVAFTSCSNEDVVELQAPTLTGETVKAQFALSLPNSYSRNSRMTSTDTQAAGNTFNGVKKLAFYGFAVPNIVANPVLAASPFPGTKFEKTTFDNPVEMTATKEQTGYYLNVDLPVGINSFLVYGQQAATFEQTGFKRGKTVWTDNLDTAAETPAGNITFSPSLIFTGTNLNAVDEAKLIQKILVNVEAATAAGGDAWRSTTKPVFKDFYEKLINNEKAYAGSSVNVRSLLETLYKQLLGTAIKDDPMAVAIRDAITTVVATEDGSKNAKLDADATGNLTWNATAPNADPAFPATSHNLPDGAAAIKWTKGNPSKVEYVATSYDGFEQNRYAYPAELLYYVNSGIYVADMEKRDDRNTTKMSWANFLAAAYPTQDKVVTASTKSVAIVNPLQYGVANLSVTAKFTDGTPKDSKSKSIDITTEGFPLVGVLVGDQKPVDWEFKQTTGDTHVIYDKEIATGTKVSTTETAANYTLVYQSKGVPTPANAVSMTNDEEVNIAIELLNDKEDFNGIGGGLIAKGTKFYLVGKIKLSATTNPNQLKHIFLQDYMTKANLTISSLKNAYNIIPDLRSPKLELGLAVNVEWQAGVTANITVD